MDDGFDWVVCGGKRREEIAVVGSKVNKERGVDVHEGRQYKARERKCGGWRFRENRKWRFGVNTDDGRWKRDMWLEKSLR